MGSNFFKSLKTHIENMSVFRLSTIFMKTNELNHSLHDVDEKKGVNENEGDKWRLTHDRKRQTPRAGDRE